MCTISNVIDVVSSVVSAAISTKAAYDRKAVNEYQANLTVKEAKIAENNAKYELQEGIQESRRKKLQSILNMGEEKSNIAAGNIALSSQTAINILDDEKLNGELDALNTLVSSERRAESYFQQADRLYANAGLRSFQSKQNFKTNTMQIWTNAIGSNSSNIEFGVDGIKKWNNNRIDNKLKQEKDVKNGKNA